ncbi:hypothetical protein DFJ74DRAFT_669689, partial [Hyaloraphidium curvatum]
MPAGAPAVSLDAVLAGASPDGAVAAALRSPLFRRRAARWRVLTDEQAAAEEPEEGDGEPALQTMAQYARKRAAEVAAGRMPQNMDDFIVLLLPMQNWEDPKTPVPDTLLSDLKDFAVLFFRGMPIALLAKHNEVQWARNEHDMDALLDGLDRCPWIPSRAKTIIGVTNIEVSGTTAVGEENARQDADEGRGADVAWAYLSSSWCFSDLEAETESGTKKVHRNLCAISSARLGDPKDPDGSMFRRVCKLVVWNICQTLVMDEARPTTAPSIAAPSRTTRSHFTSARCAWQSSTACAASTSASCIRSSTSTSPARSRKATRRCAPTRSGTGSRASSSRMPWPRGPGPRGPRRRPRRRRQRRRRRRSARGRRTPPARRGWFHAPAHPRSELTSRVWQRGSAEAPLAGATDQEPDPR